jgi:AraC-like DNA-binding protein
MEISSIELYGNAFIECFKISEDFRLARSMENDACLTYIINGAQKFHSPTQQLIIKHNESLLMKCGNYIIDAENTSPTSQLVGIVFHLDPEAIKRAFGKNDLDFLRVNKRKEAIDPAIHLGENKLIESFVNSIKPFFDDKSLISESLLSVKLQELVMILWNNGKNDIVKYILGTLYAPEYLEFEQIIEANLYHNVSIPELAHLTNQSESTFRRDFKKYYHISPAKYLKTKRLEKAVELLKQLDKPINEIAWDCGFENAAHFSTSFTKKYHKSPKVFRNDRN